MDKNGFIAIIFVFVCASTSCNASSVSHPRKLLATEHNNATTTSEDAPTESPSIESDTNPMNTGNSQLDEQKGSRNGSQTNSNMTLPVDTKELSKHENDTRIFGAPGTSVVEKNNNTVEKENGKAIATTANSINNDSCDGSMVGCRDQDMVACVQTSKDGGSEDMFLLVKNEGDSALKVNVFQVPNNLLNDLPSFEVPNNKSRRIDVSSTKGKSTELIVSSGNAKCVLPLIKPVSVENLINQLSFYSKQVTPIYALYASFLVAFLSGGMWACCRLRKRNQQNGIAYQELEMGLPEASSAVDVDGEEGWDENWDDEWDEDSSVKSPSRHVSAEGLVSRSSKKEGWEDGWDD